MTDFEQQKPSEAKSKIHRSYTQSNPAVCSITKRTKTSVFSSKPIDETGAVGACTLSKDKLFPAVCAIPKAVAVDLSPESVSTKF